MQFFCKFHKKQCWLLSFCLSFFVNRLQIVWNVQKMRNHQLSVAWNIKLPYKIPFNSTNICGLSLQKSKGGLNCHICIMAKDWNASSNLRVTTSSLAYLINRWSSSNSCIFQIRNQRIWLKYLYYYIHRFTKELVCLFLCSSSLILKQLICDSAVYGMKNEKKGRLW